MGFMDDVRADLDEVFFDTEFFAILHKIDGEDTTVIVDEDGLEEINRKESEIAYKGKANKYAVLLYIREDDLKRKYTVNSSLDYDGNMYFVNSIKKTCGLWRLLLGRNQV